DIERLQQAQAERRGLAAAGLRLCDHVATSQHRRQALRLHRGHRGVAERLDAGEQGGFERERGEGGHASMIARALRRDLHPRAASPTLYSSASCRLPPWTPFSSKTCASTP